MCIELEDIFLEDIEDFPSWLVAEKEILFYFFDNIRMGKRDLRIHGYDRFTIDELTSLVSSFSYHLARKGHLVKNVCVYDNEGMPSNRILNINRNLLEKGQKNLSSDEFQTLWRNLSNLSCMSVSRQDLEKDIMSEISFHDVHYASDIRFVMLPVSIYDSKIKSVDSAKEVWTKMSKNANLVIGLTVVLLYTE